MSRPLAYYNENDRFAAAWLRELIAAGLIAPGDVDERSIEDVRPADLDGYRQCHFFAGIGGWSAALRLAGWPDDLAIWTGSCPCQPLSGAGRRKGHADERHLWPAFYRLIAERRPSAVVGEQVASKDGREWLAAVRADLEDVGYACGAADLCSPGVGAPNIRPRLFWLAHLRGTRLSHAERKTLRATRRGKEGRAIAERGGALAGGLANAELSGPARYGRDGGARATTERLRNGFVDSGELRGLDDAERDGRRASGLGDHARNDGQQLGAVGGHGRMGDAELRRRDARKPGNQRGEGAPGLRPATVGSSGNVPPGPVDGFWRDADWLLCRDGLWRPVESGTFPLAARVPSRVGRLRGYGNAINLQVGATFAATVLDLMAED